MAVRIYELAKELGMQSPDLIDWFKRNQIPVVSASSMLTAEHVYLARKHLRDEPGASPPSWGNVTRDDLQQGWVGSSNRIDPSTGTSRPAPSDDYVHAHTSVIVDVSLCGRKLRYGNLMAWPPKGNEPCPMCWHEAEKIPQRRRPNNPFG